MNPDDFDPRTLPNGWISADCFFGWLANLFVPSIREKVQFPIMIFMDGHASHVNLAVSTFCREQGIILYCFPAHASHTLQPLDVSIYGPLKKHWNDVRSKFTKQFTGLSMNKNHFFPVFNSCWKKSTESTHAAVSGFRKCGLVPLNPLSVDYSKLME